MSDLFQTITEVYPELESKNFDWKSGEISLFDDGDGIQYIAKWEYSKPIPEGLTLGKPSA